MPTPRARTRRAVVSLTTTGTITGFYTLQPAAGLTVTAAAATVAVLACALLLPAIWSKQASRRMAALTVVRVLLNREPADPTRPRSTTPSAPPARTEPSGNLAPTTTLANQFSLADLQRKSYAEVAAELGGRARSRHGARVAPQHDRLRAAAAGQEPDQPAM